MAFLPGQAALFLYVVSTTGEFLCQNMFFPMKNALSANVNISADNAHPAPNSDVF